MRRCLALVVLAALPHLDAGRLAAEEFSAGVAVADITPPAGFRMSGYFNERLNTGVLDPLHAKALVLAQGETKAALVFCDLIGISARVSDQARFEAARRSGIPAENIAILATHSHTGPLYFGGLRKYFHERAVAEHGSDPRETVDYAAELTEKLAAAIDEAHSALRPVRLSAGQAPQEPTLSFNRRFHMKNGTVVFNPGQRNPDIIRPAGPIDPDVGVLLFDDPAAGRPLAVATVFAMHLDTVGGTLYSADYPYFLERALKGRLGDQAVSLFGAGTCGDINHIDVSSQGRRSTEEIGGLLAETVLAQLPKLAAVEAALAVRSAKVQAPLQQYPEEAVARAAAGMSKIGTRETPFLEQVEINKINALGMYESDTATLQVQVFRLGRDLAVVTLPGEVFVELGLAIKRGSPFKNTLVIELANDTPAYIPTRKAFAEGSYETVNSHIEPGGGELMVEAAVKMLKELE
ncbi:MAG: neutral/alkaline non-lysosomal ceramidase N-terminal domain-containing protein [Pirellulales bacterium]